VTAIITIPTSAVAAVVEPGQVQLDLKALLVQLALKAPKASKVKKVTLAQHLYSHSRAA